MAWSCHTPMSFLPVLISIFTVTPDLRPVSEKVRLASKTVGPEHTHLGSAWPGPPSTTGLSPASSNFYLHSRFLPGAPRPLGDAGEVLCDKRACGHASSTRGTSGPRSGQYPSVRGRGRGPSFKILIALHLFNVY